MKTTLTKVMVMLLCSLFSLNTKIQAQSFSDLKKQIPDYLPGVILFQSKSALDLRDPVNQPADFKAIANKYELESITRPFTNSLNPKLKNTYRLTFKQDKNQAILTELSAVGISAFAEQYPAYKVAIEVNDPGQFKQYALNLIQAEIAWEVSTGNPNVGIAIVDNAVFSYHEDLRDNIYLNPNESYNGLDDDLNGYVDDVRGYDVAHLDTNTAGDYNFYGTFNHGTHCAGIASASTNNGVGVASIGYNSGIIPIKAADGSWYGLAITHAIEGVAYANSLDHVNIISMSWGSSVPNITLNTVISEAYANNKVLIAAAGNDASSDPYYPASQFEVISVGASDQYDSLAYFSNYGTTVDLIAPGVDIWSSAEYTDPWGRIPGYVPYSGTSMAAPMVAGLAALVLDQHPTATPLLVKSLLQAGCDNIDDKNPDYIGSMGTGRINAGKTINPTASALGLVEEKEIGIYPNPAGDRVYISGLSSSKSLVKIYNSIGSLMFEKELNQDSYINIEELPAGLYILKTEDKKGLGLRFLKL